MIHKAFFKFCFSFLITGVFILKLNKIIGGSISESIYLFGFISKYLANHCLSPEVHFASFLSGGFTTMAVINPPEKNLANRTSVQWFKN